jgi:hypothetical protein
MGGVVPVDQFGGTRLRLCLRRYARGPVNERQAIAQWRTDRYTLTALAHPYGIHLSSIKSPLTQGLSVPSVHGYGGATPVKRSLHGDLAIVRCQRAINPHYFGFA